MTGRAGFQILRHTLDCPDGYRELAPLTRPMHWAPQCAWILTKPLRPSTRTSAVARIAKDI
jgi:hypothetical protein